jgi:hypothetical protein
MPKFKTRGYDCSPFTSLYYHCPALHGQLVTIGQCCWIPIVDGDFQ